MSVSSAKFWDWSSTCEDALWIEARKTPGRVTEGILKIWATKMATESVELFMFDTKTNLVGVYVDLGYGPKVHISPEPFASLAEARKWAKTYKSIRGEGKFIRGYFGIPA